MGLSSLPSPSDGVLLLLLVNTAVSISLFKEILRSILHFVGLHRYYSSAPTGDPDYSLSSLPQPDSITDRFRNRVKPVRFGRRRDVADCRVCLSRFEPDSIVSRLPCGHLFHTACLEKWLDYHHVTCPLCRTTVLPGDESPASWPLF